MSQNAFDVGAPIPTVNAAVEARDPLGAEDRARRGQQGAGRARRQRSPATATRLIDAARQALYASKITSYAQGMALLRLASAEYDYDIDPGEVAQDLARRLHHPRRAARRHPRGVPARSRPRQPAARSRRSATRSPQRQDGVAPRRADRRRPRHPGAGHRAPRSPTTMPIAARACRRTSRRRSAISSARTPIAASIATASFTPTGPH